MRITIGQLIYWLRLLSERFHRFREYFAPTAFYFWNMNQKRVAVYVRVSTQDQSTEIQRNEIAAYLQARGWQKLSVYEDKKTGTTADRTKLKELLNAARMREFDILVIWKLDRLARSLKDLVTILNELSELGIEFISLKDNIDMTTSSGRLMMHLIGAFAEFEAALIRERVRAGVANSRAKGTPWGRKRTRDDTKIHTLRAQGLSLRQIAKQLNISLGSVTSSLAVLKTGPKEPEKR
jgi:DNA invertase Pin-like site-specific DNA recombinase